MRYPTPSPKGYMSVEEAAEFLEVHPESLRRAIRDNRLSIEVHEMKAWRARRKFFFKVEDVMALSVNDRCLRG